MHFGFWTPVFGGWLRNVADEQTPLNFEHLKKIASYAESHGFDLTLVPELNLNDIKGLDGPTYDAWSTATALAAVTQKLQILVALRPIFHPVVLTAKQVATISDIAQGRFSINLVSGWWEEEARQYGSDFPTHGDRYALTKEYVEVLKGLWTKTPFSFAGEHFNISDTYLEPKPAQIPRIYAGGESDIGRETISQFADTYLTHGGTVDELTTKIADLKRRRRELGKAPFDSFGMAAFPIVRDTEAEALAELERITNVSSGPAYESYRDFVSKSKLDVDIDLKEYSVSNRGLRPNLVGTPEQVAARIIEFEEVGVDILLLQFSPMLTELQRFSEDVIPLVKQYRHAVA